MNSEHRFTKLTELAKNNNFNILANDTDCLLAEKNGKIFIQYYWKYRNKYEIDTMKSRIYFHNIDEGVKYFIEDILNN